MIKVDSVESSFWNDFYEKNGAPKNPSNFAKICLEYIDRDEVLLELGCGNGRDSFFFSQNNIDVIALDRSKTAVSKNTAVGVPNISFRQQDFTRISEDQVEDKIGSIYSRFTLHSVDKDGYVRTLNYCGKKLSSGGKLLIEARTTNDPLYGVGEDCGDNGFISTHYRRFLDMKKIISEITSLGFELEYAVEDYIDSWYKDDHAVVLRIIARKK